MKRCDNCQCWQRDGVDGICRAKCPKPTIVASAALVELNLVWPRTKPDDWCCDCFARDETGKETPFGETEVQPTDKTGPF